MVKMNHKIELFTIISAGFLSGIIADALTKIIVTVLAMLIGTTAAFYWKKYLEKKDNSKEDETN
jgi:hypothetical protein